MSDEKEGCDVVEILGLMTNIDESGLASLRSLGSDILRSHPDTRAHVRARGERLMQLLGLVAVDPEMVERLRLARARVTHETWPGSDADNAERAAVNALADVVLGQIGAKP